ncbi:MAG: tRNA pseudouridine(55) synthase TruB [Syntrophotaleaceae bacterium]
MNGVLVVDKPAGMTSHDVVRRLRRVCKTRRVGHAGTLDPMATGLLLVAVGEGTRVVQFLVEGDKTYHGSLLFGAETDTQDAEGAITLTRPWQQLDNTVVSCVCQQMVGELQQVPPMYSAIKIKGVALHRLARQGLEVEREPRTVHIRSLAIENLTLPHLSFEVECSKGTYVRTLCQDIGRRLGSAAHLTSLRRIRSGSFSIEEAVTLDWLEAAEADAIKSRMLSVASALRDYPALEVTAEGQARLGHGIPPALAQLAVPTDCGEGQKVLLTRNRQALAMAKFAPSRIIEKRGDFELLRVFNSSD